MMCQHNSPRVLSLSLSLLSPSVLLILPSAPTGTSRERPFFFFFKRQEKVASAPISAETGGMVGRHGEVGVGGGGGEGRGSTEDRNCF